MMRIILSPKINLNGSKKIKESRNINFIGKDILLNMIMNLSSLIIIQKMIGNKNITMNLIKNNNQDLLMKSRNFQIFLTIRNLKKKELRNLKGKNQELQISYPKED